MHRTLIYIYKYEEIQCLRTKGYLGLTGIDTSNLDDSKQALDKEIEDDELLPLTIDDFMEKRKKDYTNYYNNYFSDNKYKVAL